MAAETRANLPLLGRLPDGWAVVKFGELLNGPTRNGVYKPKKFHGTGAKMINMGELFAFSRIEQPEMKRVQLSTKELDRAAVQDGDLLFARRSLVAEGAGKCSLVVGNGEPRAFESSIIRARPDTKKVAPAFLYYLFSSFYGRYLMSSILRQVAVSGIAGSDLVNLEVPVPPLAEQQAIASVLGSLDDKIELNRRMNETLEDMARALFKSWFVNFDPVRAKMEGRQPVGVDDEIAALFPNAFEDSALGEIPKGWSVAPIGEAVRTIGGGTPSTKEPSFWDGGVHCWATPKDLSKLRDPILLDTDRKVTDAGLAKISSGLLPVGTVLLSSRAPVGYLAITQVPVAVNQGFIAMICDGPLTNHYVLHWARVAMEQIKGHAGGTTFQEISKKNFRPIQVLVPSREVLAEFEVQVAPLYDKISANLRQSAALASIRDALLPQLLSGEVRVREVEEVVQETLWAP